MIIGAVLGIVLGILLVLLLAYLYCTHKKSDNIAHRRLYENFPNEPVLRLNTDDAVEFRYQDGAAYYNPTALNDRNESLGNENYGIQMDDMPNEIVA